VSRVQISKNCASDGCFFHRQLRYEISEKIAKADFLFKIGHAAQFSLRLGAKRNEATYLVGSVTLFG
jgi:hypothetical protein